jgi:hypothetical protein
MSAERLAEAAAWCKARAEELSADILQFPGPFAKLPSKQYGAVCRQAMAYAVSLGAAQLITELGEETIEGEASIAQSLRQVQLLRDWLAVAGAQGGATDERPAKPASDVSHSDDFRSVRWYGTEYVFTPMQAACVGVLWEAWKRGSPVVGQESILEAAGSGSARLRDVFDKGQHPAWGSMIVPARKGSFRLAGPA